MTQQTPIRNQQTDFLLTPQNTVFAFIDYQPEQFQGVGSKSREDLLLNVTALGKIAKAYSIPTVLTTVGVAMGVNQSTSRELADELAGVNEIDRTTLNAWEEPDFVNAIRRTGRRKIIMAGLWTEVCVAYPTLDAIRDGYEVYPVIDAIGGVTTETHTTAVTRMVQAGAKPITALALACELQRDWARGQGDTLRGILRWYFGEMRTNRSTSIRKRMPANEPAEISRH